MAKKKTATPKEEKTSSKPKFPYTPNPPDLRRLLQIIPEKPRPPSLTNSTANTWGIKGGNVTYALGVLREIGFIDQSGTPSESYVAYMTKGTGGKALGNSIKERYKQLFELHQNPQNASDDELRNFLNINSGGAPVTINYQIRTFKVLCEFAVFDESYRPPVKGVTAGNTRNDANSGASIHFDFHLHLPEGKSSSEYESMIKSISEHIVNKLSG